jgi:hypothetical protein
VSGAQAAIEISQQGLGEINNTTIGQIMLGYAKVTPDIARMMAPWMARMEREHGGRVKIPSILIEEMAERLSKVPPKRTYQALLKGFTERLNGPKPETLTEDWLIKLVPPSKADKKLQPMARYLRTLMNGLGLTPGVVGKAIALPESEIVRICLGVDPITPSTAKLLAEYLDGVGQQVYGDRYSSVTPAMLLAEKPPGRVKGTKIVPREPNDLVLHPSVLYAQFARMPLTSRALVHGAFLNKIAADIQELASGSTPSPPKKLEPIDLLIAEIDRVVSLAGGDRQFVAAAMERSGSEDPENDLDFDPLLGILQSIKNDRELPLDREAYAIASSYLCRELFDGRFRRLADLLSHVGMPMATPSSSPSAKKTRSKAAC